MMIKKVFTYKFYVMTLLGVVLMVFGAIECLSTSGMVIWSIGLLTSFIAVCLQIIIAPNFKTLSNVSDIKPKNPYSLVWYRADWTKRKTRENNAKYWQWEIKHNNFKL